MNYVDSISLFGVNAKEIPCIKGSGEPTTATEGAVGCLYMNTDNGNMYKCVAVTDGEYSWVEVGIATAETDAKYFDIDYDGIVSLKAEYQANGSKNAELPEIIVIPDVINETAVSALAKSMFAKNLRVKSVTIPSHIRAIPEKFVSEASNVAEINGTENVESIGQAAFQRCSIKKALFPNLKQFDGVAQFNSAPFLAVVDIGNTVTSLPQNCFASCESLSLFLGGASVTSIGKRAFIATRSLKNLPFMANIYSTPVKSIGDEAFVLSRVQTDWWTFKTTSGCTFGTNATPAHFNASDWWKDCTYEPCENPLGSTFDQTNPEWASDIILGSSDTYGTGCVEVSTAHIYSALSGVKFDSPKYFVENIVGGIDNGSLLVPTITEGGEPAYGFADMANWLTHLGLECEILTDGYNSTNLQKVYDALKEGALILTGVNPGHAAVLYGIASNGEVLTLDSSAYQHNVGVYEAKTFQQPIWSIAKNGQGIVIVKKEA